MPKFVNVPVPEGRVQEVYELLARPSRATAEVLPAEPEANEEGFRPGWSQEMLERMYKESSENIRNILFAIAQMCPNWVTTVDIGNATDLTSRQVVAALGPFSKRVTGRYHADTFPFEAQEFTDEGRWKYRMSPNTSNLIMRLRLDEHSDKK